jgi:hypothetical protein
VHVAPAGAPAWAMRLCQGIHVNFLPSFLHLHLHWTPFRDRVRSLTVAEVFGSSSVWDQPTPPYASGCFGNLSSMVCVYKSLKNAIHKQPSGQRSSFPSLFATSLPLSIPFSFTFTTEFASLTTREKRTHTESPAVPVAAATRGPRRVEGVVSR